MSRQRIHFLVEGNAEQNLVERILAPHLALLGLDCFAQRFRTRRDLRRGQVFKGGGTNYAKPRKDLERMIAQWRNHPDTWLSTSFDLYEIPSDFPGYAAAITEPDLWRKVEILEGALAQDVASMGCQRFIPHVMVHEFESLLFTNIRALSTLLLGKEKEIAQVHQAVAHFQSPEHINTQKGPSGWIIEKLPLYEKYKGKELNGAINVLEVIGLPAIRQVCAHFSAWVGRIEKLATQPRPTAGSAGSAA